MVGYIDHAKDYNTTYCHYICNITFPNKKEITFYTDLSCDWVSYSLGRNIEYICSASEFYGWANRTRAKTSYRIDKFKKLVKEYNLVW
jgi:hypothetical protein